MTIDDCEGCDIVVGPCEESCFVRDCKNCTLHVAAKQLRAKNCTDCTFYLHVGSSPVIEASHDLKFGAWHLQCPGMAAQFSAAALTAANRWGTVVDSSDESGAAGNWSALPVPQQRSLATGSGEPSVALPSPSPPAAAAAAEVGSPQPQYFRVVFQGVVSVRDGPQRDAAEVGERLPGDIVEVSRVEDG